MYAKKIIAQKSLPPILKCPSPCDPYYDQVQTIISGIKNSGNHSLPSQPVSGVSDDLPLASTEDWAEAFSCKKRNEVSSLDNYICRRCALTRALFVCASAFRVHLKV